MESKKQILPTFRKDLHLFQGPDEIDGSPSFSVFDPVKNQYYKIGWGESQIIKFHEPGLSVEELCEKINTHSTLKVTVEDIKEYFEDAARHNLLARPRQSEQLIQEMERSQVHPFKWLLFHYLYVRVPLWNPHTFLQRTLSYAHLFVSPVALSIFALLSALGVGALTTRLDEFIHTFPYFFSAKGILLYALALTCVKIIHEFSHAYTAEHYNVRVSSMGVVFLVLWPVLYTDVTDGWKLLQRRHRLMISFAGIAAETIIAGLCTFGWAFAPEGIIKSLFFVISSVSWLSTLFVNANPCMRFDGYYILSDLWGIDNLQTRAFATTRWKLREWLFGIIAPSPEPHFSQQRVRAVILYSLITWTYRLILYTTIAIFVYVSFTKALGIFLFIMEIAIFILWPIVNEIRVLFSQRGYIRKKTRTWVTSAVLLSLFLWLATPLPRKETFVGITVPDEEQLVYIPYNARVKKILVSRNQHVNQGDPLVILESRELETELKSLSADEAILQRKIKILGYEEESRTFLAERWRELQVVRAKKESVLARIKALTLKAQVGGELYSWNEYLKENQAVSKDQIVGKIASTAQKYVVAFVPEDRLTSLFAGQEAVFFSGLGHERYPARIEQINPSRAGTLHYPALASIYHGPLPVVKDVSGALALVDSYYPVRAELEEGEERLPYGMTGTLRVEGPKRSLLVSFIKKTINIFWKESGL